MPTEMELKLEQTRQGVSYEVSKLETNSYAVRKASVLSGIEVSHGPWDAMHKPLRYSISHVLTDLKVTPTQSLGRMTHAIFVNPRFMITVFMQDLKDGGGGS
ncbi:hypothetical protein Tco_0317174 [Tanacetum coccineum]